MTTGPVRRLGRSLVAVATVAVGATMALGGATPAGAATVAQNSASTDVNCNLNGLHQGTGPVSTCDSIDITSEVLVDGANVSAGSDLDIGDVVTVRLTVAPRGGHDAFYEETVDGSGTTATTRGSSSTSICRWRPAPTSGPANVRMSRTDTGDRGNGPMINCLAHNGQEAARSDALTNITLGAAGVGGTKMSASKTGNTVKAVWDDMAWDRCVNVLSNNGFYPGHVVEFTQTVLSTGAATLNPTWTFGQVAMARDDGSRQIRWGSDSAIGMSLPPDDGTCDNPPPSGFSDVPTGKYYSKPIDWLVAKGITNGTAPGIYSPTQVVARGQMATFLWRYAGQPGGSPAHSSATSPPVRSHNDAVSWLVAEGITTGVSAGVFSPDGLVTRRYYGGVHLACGGLPEPRGDQPLR
ncbi:MAG: S-layer homology domain-containing protein [Microthrixaceae bacterium]